LYFLINDYNIKLNSFYCPILESEIEKEDPKWRGTYLLNDYHYAHDHPTDYTDYGISFHSAKRIRSPSSMFEVGDGFFFSLTVAAGLYDGSAQVSNLKFKHSQQSNILYCDGHVDTVRRYELTAKNAAFSYN